MSTLALLTLALLLDRLLGEPRQWHPLIGFGYLARRIEHFFIGSQSDAHPHPQPQRWGGVVALGILIIPVIGVTTVAIQLPYVGVITELLLLYLALGGRSLGEHAAFVYQALLTKDILLARDRTGMIVSRDTEQMDEQAVVKATIESVLENGCDAVFGVLFWFLVAGAPGVVFYRLVNTLDAMWGYKSPRYLYFGWAAARLDDLLNLVPARLTALTYASVGKFRNALACWGQQGDSWESPNAGPVMAAGAGALMIQLGGIARYRGEIHQRPILGAGRHPEIYDINRALELIRHGITLWLIILALAFVLGAWMHV